MKTDASFSTNCQICNVLPTSSTFTNLCLAYLLIFLFDLSHPLESACRLKNTTKKTPKPNKQQKKPSFFLLYPCQSGHFKDSATSLIRIKKKKAIKSEIIQVIWNVFMGGSKF